MELTHLSDDDLLSQLHVLVRDQRTLLVRLLVYLGEVEERRLHLQMAYASTFELCTQRFSMSEGEAFRRTTAARLARRYPRILEGIDSGALSLSSVVLLRHYITPENHGELLDSVAGMSTRAVEKYLAARFPRPDAPTAIQEKLAIIEPLSAGRYRVQFTASEALCEKIEHATDLMRHRIPDGDLATVIERALDVLIAKVERERFGKTARPKKAPDVTAPGYVPKETVREVVARDGQQCSYVAPDGRRCTATAFLELEHVDPRGKGGGDDASNVCVFCHAHNQHAAERAYGRGHIEAMKHLRRRKYRDPWAVAARSLTGLGFAEAQASRALDLVKARHASTPPLEVVLREAIAAIA